MDNYIFNILIYCIPTIGAVFLTVAIISKIILRKNGYKVTFFYGITLSDIKNMNKLSKVKTDLRVLYYSMLISDVSFLSLFLLVFIVVISDIISRS